MSHALPKNATEQKLDQLLHPDHSLCREDIVWILEFIKKKVAERDPRLLDLSQPRLMTNYQYFAEISLLLINRRCGFDQEADRLKQWVKEAVHGLVPDRQSRYSSIH